MSDADKAAAIKAAYDYADGIAKQYVRRETKIPSWVEKAAASGNPSQYIADTIIMKTVDTDGNGNFSNAEKVREYMTTENGNCQLGDMLERAQRVKVPDTVTLDVYEFYNDYRFFEVLANDSNFDRNPLRRCNYGLEGGAVLCQRKRSAFME